GAGPARARSEGTAPRTILGKSRGVPCPSPRERTILLAASFCSPAESKAPQAGCLAGVARRRDRVRHADWIEPAEPPAPLEPDVRCRAAPTAMPGLRRAGGLAGMAGAAFSRISRWTMGPRPRDCSASIPRLRPEYFATAPASAAP